MLGQVPARPKASKLRGAEHRNGLFGGLRWRKQARIDSAQDARRDRSIAALGLIQQAPAVDSSQGKFLKLLDLQLTPAPRSLSCQLSQIVLHAHES
jgi:hypothetical protein